MRETSPKGRFRRSLIKIAAPVLLFAALLAWLWRHGEPPALRAPAPSVQSAETERPGSLPDAALVPAPVSPDQASFPAPGSAAAPRFVGSAVCGECHKKQHAGWKRDWHARALSRSEPAWVVGRFDGTHFAGSSSEAWMRRQGARFIMRAQVPSGSFSDFLVDWVIGGKRMQDAVTVLPDGRWQILPVYYHVTGGGEWVDYNEAKQGRIGPDHPFFWTNFRRNANHECLDCHTSGLRTGYARGSGRFTTEFADAGVGCESCHGPGGRHAEDLSASSIIHPGKLDRERALDLCAQCHGPRDPLFPIFDSAHRYQPGQRYEDSYQPLVVVLGSGRSGEYFPDGRPKSSSFEYQALLQSLCYRRGGVTCLSCHAAPHDSTAQNELRPERKQVRRGSTPIEDAACVGCHGAIAAQGIRHTHHRGVAARCTSCHMPKVVSGVLDRFADHAIDVPAPQNTERHGIPSACGTGTCHRGRAPALLTADLLRLWPDAGQRQARRLRLADAIDEATAGQSLPALRAVLVDRKEAPTLRGACAVLLAQRFPRVAAEALLPLLREADPLLRARAIEALGYAGARGAVGALIPLWGDPSLRVRHAAAVVAATLGDPRGEQALARLAAEPQSSGLVQPHYVLGMLAARRGDLRTATRELERTADLMPYFTDALSALGEVYLRAGQAELARARFREVLAFAPKHPQALRRLAQLGVP